MSTGAPKNFSGILPWKISYEKQSRIKLPGGQEGDSWGTWVPRYPVCWNVGMMSSGEPLQKGLTWSQRSLTLSIS